MRINPISPSFKGKVSLYDTPRERYLLGTELQSLEGTGYKKDTQKCLTTLAKKLRKETPDDTDLLIGLTVAEPDRRGYGTIYVDITKRGEKRPTATSFWQYNKNDAPSVRKQFSDKILSMKDAITAKRTHLEDGASEIYEQMREGDSKIRYFDNDEERVNLANKLAQLPDGCGIEVVRGLNLIAGNLKYDLKGEDDYENNLVDVKICPNVDIEDKKIDIDVKDNMRDKVIAQGLFDFYNADEKEFSRHVKARAKQISYSASSSLDESAVNDAKSGLYSILYNI